MKYLLAVFLAFTIVAHADQRCVLAEYTTNAGCGTCPAATLKLYGYLDTTAQRSHIALVVYHSPYPAGAVDPFYSENVGEITSRDHAYNVINNPTLHIDGVNVQDQSYWPDGLQTELANATPLALSLDGTINGRSGLVNVHLTQAAPAGYKLFAVITETYLEYQGTNNEQYHNDVFRKTIGGWSGVDLGAATTTQFSFNLGIDSLRDPGIPHPWDPDSCRIIVWLQNPATYNTDVVNVSQAAQIWVSELTPSTVRDARVPVANVLAVSPNPAHDFVDVQLSSRTPDMQLSIVDLVGRTVYASGSAAIPRHLTLAGLPAGAYRAVLSNHGCVTSSVSLVRN